jgi:hypothetical protein
MPADEKLSYGQFHPLLKTALGTNTVDALKTIHEVALGHDELGSINDALDLDTVRSHEVERAHHQIRTHAQQTLVEAGFPEEMTVWRQMREHGHADAGVVAASTQRISLYERQRPFLVNRADVLTHGEGILPGGAYSPEKEVHVELSKLRPKKVD